MGQARVLSLIVASLVVAVGCGDDAPSDDAPPRAESAALRVSSPAFTEGSRLAERYTCDGAGEEPLVKAGTVPPSTSELLVGVYDRDAPGGTFVHLTRFGISPRGDGSLEGGKEGRNSADEIGWTPPCPPEGDAPHRYTWMVFALRDPSGLEAGAKPGDVAAAVRSGVLASGTISAKYGR